MSDIKKILIFNPFGIGDVLFTTPLIRNLKENFICQYLAYICNGRAYPLLKNNPFLDEIFIFEKDYWREILKESWFKFCKQYFSFLQKIRKMHFDVVFDLSLNSQYGLFFKMSGIKRRIGFNFKKRGRFLTEKLDIPTGFSQKHVARFYLDLLKFLKINPKEYNFDVFIENNAVREVESILVSFMKENNAFVLVCPGSGDSWGKAAYFRRWPEDNFVDLCNKIQNNLSFNVVLTGSKAEMDICQYIYDKMEGKPINLCGKINLEEFVALISKSKLIITNDGGPFHIARALNKKIIVFFGPVDEKVYGPYLHLKDTFVFSKQLNCRPCYKGFRFLGCQYDKKCLREISPDEVYLTVREILKE
ncbi:MAG: glycosyltransferase family 9 protein [Candidatus Omnitrophica bacterium]|nr:glycosyltransferase family 9 protein [Candidatus Omnitrophota bacterium]